MMQAQHVSPQLQAFVAAYQLERGPILEFMLRAARELPSGARVLDVGAGEAPYGELFTHLDYRTSDWQNSVHPGARAADYIGSADKLPVADCAFDAVINTQVLEHVAEPAAVLAELHRVLRPGGRLYISVPLAWELHEEPYDFYRYTAHGLRHVLECAGFVGIDVQPRNDSFSTLAQLMRNASYVMGRRADGLDPQREFAAHVLRNMADLVATFAPLDTQQIFPLGYTAIAHKAARVPNSRSSAVGALASELIAQPDLLAAYAGEFGPDDNVTLVIVTAPEEVSRVQRLAEQLGLDGNDAPDMLVTAPAGIGRGSVDAWLSQRSGPVGFAAVPRFDQTNVSSARNLLGG